MVAKKSTDKTAAQEANEAASNSDQYSAGPGPNPYWQSANVVTTEGGTGARVEDVAPIFAQAKADALAAALDAVKDGDHETVVLPEDGEDKSNKEAVSDLRASAKAAKEDAKDASEGVVKSEPQE